MEAEACGEAELVAGGLSVTRQETGSVLASFVLPRSNL